MAVTPNMIAVALGQTAPASGSSIFLQWEMWIQDANMLIETRKEKIDPDLVISEAMLDYVVRQAVVAHVKKPDDSTQVTVAIDDGSTSKSYTSGKGRVSIDDEWWELLNLEEKNEGAFSIDMLGTGSAHAPWCSLHFGANYCSCGVSIAGTPIYEGGDEL